MSTPVVRVALYTRVSTDIQANKEEGSLDTQEARLQAAVLSRSGHHEVRQVFREEGESGKSLDRPALQRLLAGIRSKQFDLVLVTRIDRLSRSLLDFYEVYRLLEETGVQFVSLNETFDTSTAVGRAMLKLVLVFAELEREQTAERTRLAMQARAERGLWNGGHPPLGYDSGEGGHLAVNEDEATLVRLIFDRYLELRSTHTLAAWLNDHGYRQKQFHSRRKGATGGGKFTIGSVLLMLQNRLYLGEVSHKEKWFKGQHAAIVDPEVFDRVQSVVEGNAKHRRGPPLQSQHNYLLTGIARCSCGYALTTSAGNGAGGRYFYYRCVGVFKKVPDHKCDVRQVRAEPIEAEVMSIVREVARDPRLVDEATAEANRIASQEVNPLRERVAALRKESAASEARAHEVLGQILRGGLGESQTARQMLSELEARVQQLRQALAEAEGELATRETDQLNKETVLQALRGFDTVFDRLTPAEQREFLGLLLKRVTVSADRIEVELYEGTRAVRMLQGLRKAGRGVRGPVRGEHEDCEQKHETPDRGPGFVSDLEWLPLVDRTRTFLRAGGSCPLRYPQDSSQ